MLNGFECNEAFFPEFVGVRDFDEECNSLCGRLNGEDGHHVVFVLHESVEDKPMIGAGGYLLSSCSKDFLNLSYWMEFRMLKDIARRCMKYSSLPSLTGSCSLINI